MIFGMKRQQAIKLAIIAGSAVLLQGCIAAVVPLAAGGLFTRAGTGEGTGGGEGTEPVEVVRAEQTPAAPVAASSPEVEAAIAENVAAAEVETSTPVETQDTAEDGTQGSAQGRLVVAEEAAPAASTEPEVAETAAAAEASAPPVQTAAAPPPAALPSVEQPQVEAPAVESAAAIAAADAAIAADVSAPTEVSPAPVSTAPTPTTAQAARVPTQGAVTLFDPLVGYATTQQSMPSDARISAMLSDPAELRPARITCESGTPTVMIDLDPEGENLPVAEPLSAPSALGVKLAQMRAQGIDIAWISQVSADHEGAIRSALTRSGLDLAGADQVLLMRTPDERKQSRRDELAEGACVVAIAGDTRSDFHELFDYLLNPNDAFALQPLIGDGWFIIPTPLLPEGLNR